ncbi:MAG: DNA phosphorothioation system sulfurtransferase DndC [Hydrogenophaga sp.]|nr:DNA phosphorothioation system sulfurtransferase DndC [Hydrogenophaga sp.]
MTDGIFADAGLAARIAEIQQVYLSDNRPWVVGYSGGKDSTCTLQLVWVALTALPPEQRRKPVYVISSDTLVETPVIVRYIDVTLERIEVAAKAQGLPIQTQKVMPKVDRSFWVNLIGRGYPAPSRRFRWCTERLKIEPADEFIRERVAEYGEVVMVLGVRTSESATRAQSMSFHRIKGSALSRHSSLLNAFVYAPIEAFSTDDVWTYLLQNESPWGNDNRDLVAMYRNASAGECPLVVDTTTPSCGNSRFGCWVCTVVTKDKSMEAMIDSGEDWLEPLLDYRDMLAETQDPEKKKLYRDFRRRSGQVSFIGDSATPVPGPYTLDFCRELLSKLLKTQVEVHRNAPPGENAPLIHEAELHEIRRIWRSERGDWADSVPSIVRDELGRDLDWVIEDNVSFTREDAGLLDELCAEHDVPTELVTKLLDVERAAHGLKRRHAVHTRIEDLFKQEWRGVDEIVAERRQKLIAEGHAVSTVVADAEQAELELDHEVIE